MQGLVYVGFLTFCITASAFPIDGAGPECRVRPPSAELGPEANSAAFYFTRSRESDGMAVKYLDVELRKDGEFERNWEEARERWRRKNLKAPSDLREEHVIAVAAYSERGVLHRRLNDAVRSYGADTTTYNACFQLKSMHYLLTVALEALRNGSSGLLVYRGTEEPTVGRKGAAMRFGSFALASRQRWVAEGFGTGSFFTVNTSYGTEVQSFAFEEYREEVLIPPYEQFEIAGQSRQGEGHSYALRSRGFSGAEVGLKWDHAGRLTVYRKTAWWVWLLVALACSVILGGIMHLVRKRRPQCC